jgi:pescadillo protein
MLHAPPATTTTPQNRYPSFIDALRDMDDPLTMVHLFATLPAEATKDIKPATVDRWVM